MNEQKGWTELVAILESMESVAIGFSGGVDSALLSVAATLVLGQSRVVAVLVDSPSLPRRELDLALKFAESHSLPLQVVRGREMQDPNYVKNGADRCFYCKSDLSSHLIEVQTERGFRYSAYGQNSDDGNDYRPGIRAAMEKGVRAPLAEAGLTKQNVRALAHHLGLSLWDKPAMPCLSSRIPYGIEVTEARLFDIEQGELFLESLGFQIFRVRSEADGARIEIEKSEWAHFGNADLWNKIEEQMVQIGFRKAWLDPGGFQPGSLNLRL